MRDERRLVMHSATSRAARIVLAGITAVLLTYLLVRAVRPSAKLPGPLGWFGAPGHGPTIAIVVALILALCVLVYRSRSNRSSATVPVLIVIGLTLTSLILGFVSYWGCFDAQHPAFFTPLVWTPELVKGA